MTVAPYAVVLGDLNIDIVVSASGPLRAGSDVDADIVMRHGGSAANMAAWLAHERASVTFIGCVGNDALGRDARATLQHAGVTLAVQTSDTVPTGTCVVLVDPHGERTMLPDPGANLLLREDDLPWDVIDNAAVLLVSGYALLRPGPRPAAVAAIQRAHAHGIRVVVDAASSGPLRDVGGERFLRWVGPAWILANSDEMTALTEHLDPAAKDIAAARLLSERLGTVVLKRGADGASLAQNGSIIAQMPAVPATVIDSTGAGDACAAGFVAALLAGAGTVEAVQRGVTLGALAVSRRGGRPTD